MEPSNAHLYISIEFLALVAGHYIPYWIKIFGELSNPWRLIFNYTYGVACIIGSFNLWLRDDLPTDPHFIGWTLTGFAICGGVTVAGMYLFDTLWRWSENSRTLKTINAHLERRRDGEADRTQ